jgi:methylated-DNA-[protein]-cysteine S-methyltransferase
MKIYTASFPFVLNERPATAPTAANQFSIAVDSQGRVVATAFGGIDALRTRARLDEAQEEPSAAALARRQVEEYFAGRRTRFDLPLAPHGSSFQHRVWDLLSEIPFGETRSYGQLAKQLGSSARAVGRANATNPICLIVPCHRVIGSDGKLTGFAFGEQTKAALLALEQRPFAGLVAC